jgi:hypothetical protein
MTTRSAPVAVVAGAIAQRPRVGGHAWVFLNWLLGLQSIGFEVLFLDRLDGDMQSCPGVPVDRSAEWSWLDAVMAGAGLQGRFALLHDAGRESLGLRRSEVLARCRKDAVLFNVMGFLDDEELLATVGHRIFVDIDPGFPQMWHADGLDRPFTGHDAFVTVGLAVGDRDCSVPTCDRHWVTTTPPVALDAWPMTAPLSGRVRADHHGSRARLTTVATWRGPNGPVEFEGVTYGLRAHEQRAYRHLPNQFPQVTCELALDIDDADAADATALIDGGWQLVDPRQVAGTTQDYQAYIANSDAELMVAKGMYVRSRGGWFSDRSACYLASGRPVIAQDTGWTDYLPAGEGLLSFADPDEAEECIATVTGDLHRHSRVARSIAVECFDARKVLPSVLARCGAD